MSDYNQKPWYEKESEVGPERAANKTPIEELKEFAESQKFVYYDSNETNAPQ